VTNEETSYEPSYILFVFLKETD